MESSRGPAPKATTVPIISWPRTMGSCAGASAWVIPSHWCTSEPQIDATSTRTSNAPGSSSSSRGTGSSRISIGELPVPREDELEPGALRSEEHTSELQSRPHLVCRLLLETKNKH